MKRIPLWVGPFNERIEEIRSLPFEWYENDCGPNLVGKNVEILTGEKLYQEFEGRYNDAGSAYRVMREAGFDDLADLVAAKLPEYEHPSEAQIGDIAAIPTDTVFKHVLGIFNGERIFVMSPSGLGTVDRSKADRAFKVG